MRKATFTHGVCIDFYIRRVEGPALRVSKTQKLRCIGASASSWSGGWWSRMMRTSIVNASGPE